MTGRQRFSELFSGASVSPPLVVGLEAEAGADAVAANLTDLTEVPADRAKLARVLNPFGRAMAQNIDLNSTFDADPDAGQKQLEALAEQVKADAKSVQEAGCDGTVYVLEGAHPAACTPMEFGGRYLELDRELIALFPQPVILWVEAPGEAYLDFVSDLPATVFGWSAKKTGTDPSSLRALREGLLLSDVPTADLLTETAREVAHVR